MQDIGSAKIIDYTSVPVGLVIQGHLWTGQEASSTAMCPKCGRIGVISSGASAHQIIVHSGRIDGDMLIGTDYCSLERDTTHGKSKVAI
jgi:hypothetical protein